VLSWFDHLVAQSDASGKVECVGEFFYEKKKGRSGAMKPWHFENCLDLENLARSAYAVLTQCLRSAYAVLTQCLRSAWGKIKPNENRVARF
jgi:hypothetical protein